MSHIPAEKASNVGTEHRRNVRLSEYFGLYFFTLVIMLNRLYACAGVMNV